MRKVSCLVLVIGFILSGFLTSYTHRQWTPTCHIERKKDTYGVEGKDPFTLGPWTRSILNIYTLPVPKILDIGPSPTGSLFLSRVYRSRPVTLLTFFFLVLASESFVSVLSKDLFHFRLSGDTIGRPLGSLFFFEFPRTQREDLGRMPLLVGFPSVYR